MNTCCEKCFSHLRAPGEYCNCPCHSPMNTGAGPICSCPISSSVPYIECALHAPKSDTHEGPTTGPRSFPSSKFKAAIEASHTDTSEGWRERFEKEEGSKAVDLLWPNQIAFFDEEIDRARDEAAMSVTYHRASYEKGRADTLERCRKVVDDLYKKNPHNAGLRDALYELAAKDK